MPEAGFASLGPTLLARKGGAKPAMRPQLTPIAQSAEEMAALADEQLEDLGWNDMGDDQGEEPGDERGDNSGGEEVHSQGAEIVPILPIRPRGAGEEDERRSRSPVVRRQQKHLLDRVLADAAMNGCEDEMGEEEEDLSARYFEDHEDAGESAGQPFDDALDDTIDGSFEQASHVEPQATAPQRRKPVRKAPARPSGKRAAFTLRLDTERHLKLRLAATMQGVSAQALVTEALDALLGEFEELDALAARMRRH